MNFTSLENATKKAFNRMSSGQSASGKNSDLDFYRKLTPDQLNMIASIYGPDNLTIYVREMETKMAKEGTQNGN